MLRLTRDAVFGLEHRLQGRGLRAEIVTLCGEVSPVPEVSFTGPVDGALDPARAVQLAQALRDALGAIVPHLTPSRVALAVSETACTAEIEAAGVLPSEDPGPAWFARLTGSAKELGISLAIHPAPGAMRFAWSVPLGAPATLPAQRE